MEEIYSRIKTDSVIVTNEPFLVELTKSNILLHEFLVMRMGMTLLLLLLINFLTTLLLKYKF
jgi:hypothetical protein